MFIKKTPAEFEALSEYQKEKYLDEKSQHEAKQMQEAADKSAKEAVESMRKEIEEKNADLLKKLEESNADKLKELADKHQIDIEEMEKVMKRAKIGEINTRLKGMPEMITEKLSTPEGEAMIKALFNGQREKFVAEFEGDEALKAMSTPVGGVAPQFGPIVGPGHDEVHARNVIPVLPTTTNLYKFIQYVLDTEADGFGMVAEGGLKPTIEYIPTVKEAPVRKIAAIITLPDELMDDVVGFRAWIAYELPKAYLDAEDQQIFKGDGTGENILGLWYQADYQTLPLGGADGVTQASNTIDKIAAGITEVRLLKRSTSAVFLNPIEYMKVFINKGNTEEYSYPVILDASGTMRIGGVPIYWTNILDSGEGLVGDFARGTAIMQRKGMSIGYFEQNKDNVEKNMITIRVEARFALPIFYPEAFLRLFPATT